MASAIDFSQIDAREGDVTFGTREPGERDMKRKLGCGPGLIGLGLLFGFVVGEHYLAMYIDKRRFPWGYANSGTPPLVGTWIGPFTTRSGKRLAMLLDLQLVPLGRDEKGTPIIRTDRHGGWLEARVLVCDGPGRVRHLEASGRPNDDRASHFHLATSPIDKAPPEGLAPSHLYGSWDGADSLALEASLYLMRGKSAITKSDDPDTGLRKTPLTLRRGTEAAFNALCVRLQ